MTHSSSRRRLTSRVTRAVLASVLLLLLTGAPGAQAADDGAPSAQDTETTTPIKHFVFLMQENHTFDNYFGTRPGVDGIPTGTCMPAYTGRRLPCVKPYHIGDEGVTDLDHTEAAFQAQYADGAMNGFVRYFTDLDRPRSQADLTMGYYDETDLPYYWNIADNYVLFDRLFSSARGGSVQNHMYRVTGSPGYGTNESIPPGGWGNIPTIFDRLEESGISWKFYVQNYDRTINFRTRDDVEDADRAAQVVWVPLLAYARFIDDPELNSHIVDLREYYQDVQRGSLPSVAYIAPSGNSEHPPGSIQAGERFVRSLINELMKSRAWDSSAFFWSYDDWGGWYDHVKPPQVDKHGYGFRVPALLVSPYAKPGFVDHTTLDFTSALKFIEENWGVDPLAARDRKANNLTNAFDFDSPPRPAVILDETRTEDAPQRPTVSWVYLGYVVIGLLALGAFWVTARRRTQDTSAVPHGEPEAAQ